MNKFVMCLFAALFSFSIYAADFPEKSMPMTSIIGKLEAKGFVDVYEVEYDDKVYHVKARNAQGKDVEATVDPISGKITPTKVAPSSKITLMDAVKKVEQAGYHNIYKIERSDDKYEMSALDKDGKKVSLEVDGKTGKISSDFF